MDSQKVLLNNIKSTSLLFKFLGVIYLKVVYYGV